MAVGEDAPQRRSRAALVATAALAVVVGVACGGGSSAEDQAGFGSSSVSAASTAETATTQPATGNPFPDGVYQWSLTPEDWTAAGLPADTDADVEHHVVTFTGGTAYDIAILRDGTREAASVWRYAPSDDHQITMTDDDGRSLTLQWNLADDELRFLMDPGQGDPHDRVLWTAQALRKVG